MALLRMLAFAPASADSASRGEPPVRPKTVSEEPLAGTPAATPQADTAESGDIPRPTDEGSGTSTLSWAEIIEELGLTGMARMLAQHSELVEQDADRLVLMVPEAHRHLLDKPYRDKLQAALEERFGRKLRVEFTLGQATGNTPAEREDQERQARQRTAIEAIDRDPFVRELVENFDARVVDESIRPLQPAPGGAGEGQ